MDFGQGCPGCQRLGCFASLRASGERSVRTGGLTARHYVARVGSWAWRTICCMLTVAEAADRLGRNPETVRRWIRSGRLPSRRVGARHAIDDRDLRVIEDELHPMSELPEEWRVGDDGTPALNWVAALHRSRSGH
jgi:excisionase family DNA binding protein